MRFTGPSGWAGYEQPAGVEADRGQPQLTERFENCEPDPNDELPVEEYLLERTALARARSERRQIVDAVATAHSKNVPWTRIGELLGTSAQAAQQRYGNVIATS